MKVRSHIVLLASVFTTLAIPATTAQATVGSGCDAAARTWVEAHQQTARAERAALTDRPTARAAADLKAAKEKFASDFLRADLGSYSMGYDLAQRVSDNKPIADQWRKSLDPAALQSVITARDAYLQADAARDTAKTAALTKETEAYRDLVRCLDIPSPTSRAVP